MSTDKAILAAPIPTVLNELAKELEDKPWALASETDESVKEKSLQAAKALFDLSVSCEQFSHPHIQPFLVSILAPPTIETRSKSKDKSAQEEDKGPIDPNDTLPYTPLDLLTVDGFDPEQVWAQLELKNEGLVPVLSKMGDQEGEAPEGIEELSDASSDDMTLEEFREMLKEAGYEGIDEMTDEEVEELKEEMEGDDGEGEKMSLEDFKEMYREAGEDVDNMTEEELLERMEEMEGGADSDDSVTISDDSSEESSGDEDEDEEGVEEEDEDEEMLSGDDDEIELSGEDDEEEEDEEDEKDDEEEGASASDDEQDDASALFSAAAGPSKPRKSKSKHPTLDDDFFSIDEFNRQTEELEAGRVTSGGLGGEEDDEEELQDVGSMMLEGAGDDDEITYADFFEPPKGGAKKASSTKDKKGKGKRSKKPKYDEDEDMEEEEEADEVGDDEDAFGVMGRVKGDLFDSDDEGEQEEQVLSAHEKRQKALALQIAELEDQAVGPKEWTLLGEASSKARPENSLLEEDLDFEQVAKVVPVITEDSVKTMEELIKRRILDNNFDSPVRVRAYEPTPFLPSRFFDLQDTQSAKSLAQIYEEEYQAAASGEKVKDARDEKLNKAHQEIDGLWNDICYKLDALSSLNFVPKAPKANISTISDLPTTTMESALPPTSAASTMLAPQELFAAPSSSSLVARSELTSEDAQALRTKHRRHKKADRKKLGEMEELYGKKKQSVKEQKEEALKGLVKSGKGVTIVGKGGKEQGKVLKRGGEGQGEQDGKRLKL
ncbi:hypothetical protein IAR50_006211 [Cryptococcus sp. DSM 104548]